MADPSMPQRVPAAPRGGCVRGPVPQPEWWVLERVLAGLVASVQHAESSYPAPRGAGYVDGPWTLPLPPDSAGGQGPATELDANGDPYLRPPGAGDDEDGWVRPSAVAARRCPAEQRGPWAQLPPQHGPARPEGADPWS